MEHYSSLFVYGTLAIPQLRAALIGSCEVLSPAYLPGFTLANRIDGFPFCVPDANGWVTGCILELSQQQWQLIAAWEDAPHDYFLQETMVYYLGKPQYSRFYNGNFQVSSWVPVEGWQPKDWNLMQKQIQDFLFLYEKGSFQGKHSR